MRELLEDTLYKRLYEAVKTFIEMELNPTPASFRQIGMALLELREIMLEDNPFDTLTEEAVEIIEHWIENTKRGNSYDLYKELRKLREETKGEE
jgi:hypothetical protein